MRVATVFGPLATVLCAIVGCTVAGTPAGSVTAGTDPPGSPSPAASTSAPGAPAAGGSAGAGAASRLPAAAVIVAHFRLKDGAVITTARFTGAIRFVLYCGSVDPGPRCRGKVTDSHAISPSERGLLVAAFNGGFKLSAHDGGYEQEGRIISPLHRGFASLVIYRSGAASIGVWGHGEPAAGQPVYSVRQNLGLLVSGGRPTAASAANWGNWGGTVTGVENTARSALGQNASGQIIYVASTSATPPDMASALVRAGAVTGMELDINIEWVQLDYALRPGGPLAKPIPGQWRPANQYLTGWTRDFIAVLAQRTGNGAPVRLRSG